ncbi:type II toxin-antitoxin system HicB family antitoxin [Fructobacillus evanidus]|uniref:Antitoxin component HicB of the HicAB toxin-antitoxin system (HicB) n=1 Tax=Fructobacillus evanidus TaxID=3064281 RepID=A0ABN9YTY0_9LACO|nr:Antitoxin component HicB of the HicAB toxin-antitoxin system (HicB) [Fructobacillus sp. LMG 32999]CAK1235057.1 Antitoxin component HicB of the HicAB toxin-antitoxin system (HicB) [Fructobacillus sp. LMG 32999]CAK1235359.1 Antitoxin component HicB of the HicAB toxin-antitoxin system (HicB) [Fructobacillus sp. LMG 32999]CAK1238982.1 Antitoxin component HicB of the HicAB toxin-antitoxin system (HicB) [Fructobacillus sp. LMG 32999]CAK1239430.1 Antitoxin component HicB of the HicAB toxin-antitoxi
MDKEIEFVMSYPVVIHQEDDMFWASVPDVPSAFTTGATVEEILVKIKEAIELALSTTLVVPEPTKFSEVDAEDGFVQMVTVSLIDYLRASSKTIRKNVTVPSYLSDLAKKNGDNVSEILTKALEKRYGIG